MGDSISRIGQPTIPSAENYIDVCIKNALQSLIGETDDKKFHNIISNKKLFHRSDSDITEKLYEYIMNLESQFTTTFLPEIITFDNIIQYNKLYKLVEEATYKFDKLLIEFKNKLCTFGRIQRTYKLLSLITRYLNKHLEEYNYYIKHPFDILKFTYYLPDVDNIISFRKRPCNLFNYRPNNNSTQSLL
jgi:uncharacterized protein YpbB